MNLDKKEINIDKDKYPSMLKDPVTKEVLKTLGTAVLIAGVITLLAFGLYYSCSCSDPKPVSPTAQESTKNCDCK